MPRATGLDAASDGLRAAVVRCRSGRLELQRLVHLDVRDVPGAARGLPAGEAAALFSRGLRESRVPLAHVVGSMPGNQAVLRVLSIPPVPKWKLDLIMRYEMDGMRPPDASEILGDYSVLGTFGEAGEWRILAAMARPEAGEERIAFLRSLGAGVEDLTPSAVALFEFLSGDPEFVATSPALGVHIGRDAVDICLSAGARLLFARSVMPGAARLDEAAAIAGVAPGALEIPAEEMEHADELKVFGEGAALADEAAPGEGTEVIEPAERRARARAAAQSAASEMASAIRAALMFARSQAKEGDPQAAWLAGPYASVPGLAAFLAGRLGFPVRLATLPSDLSDRELPEAERASLRANPSACAIAVGLARLAVRPGALRLSLLPSAFKARTSFFQRELFLRIAAGLFAAGLFVSLLGGFFSGNRLKGYVAHARDQIGKARQEEERLLPMERQRDLERARSKALIDEIAVPRKLLSAIVVLRRKTPPSITLTDFPQDPNRPAIQFGMLAGPRGQSALADRGRIWVRGIVDIPDRSARTREERLAAAIVELSEFAKSLKVSGLETQTDPTPIFLERPRSPGSTKTEAVIVFEMQLTMTDRLPDLRGEAAPASAPAVPAPASPPTPLKRGVTTDV